MSALKINAGTDPTDLQLQCNGRPVTVNLNLGQTPGTGSDVILGTPGNDDIFGLGGNDTICGKGGDYTITAGGGDDDRVRAQLLG